MELSELREKINLVDEQILTLFLQRMTLAEEVAAYKIQHHQPIVNAAREQEILDKVTECAGERAQYARRLFTTLMELSRSRQAELMDTAAAQGERASERICPRSDGDR